MNEFVLYDNVHSAFIKRVDGSKLRYTVSLQRAMHFIDIPNVGDFIAKWQLNPTHLTILRVML